MPHDRDGNPLNAGDLVTVQAVVKAVQVGDEYCNVTLETVEVMYPSENKSTLTLNAKQVVRADS